MITVYKKTKEEHVITTLDTIQPGTWIHVEAPTEEELNRLTNECSFKRNLLTDALDVHEVPRIEQEDGMIYLYTRLPYRDAEDRVITLPLLIALGNSVILTATQRNLPFLEKLTLGPHTPSTTHKTKLLFLILLEITTSYNRFLTAITRQVRRMDIHPEHVEDKHIVQFVMFENTLNDFLSALVPMRASLQSILLGKLLRLKNEEKQMLEDVLQDTVQLVEMGKSILKSIVNIRTAHSAIMTNDLNRVMKRLTALTVILTVPTMIASFYGMNIALPLGSSPFAFVSILILILCIISVLLFVFSKNRWL